MKWHRVMWRTFWIMVSFYRRWIDLHVIAPSRIRVKRKALDSWWRRYEPRLLVLSLVNKLLLHQRFWLSPIEFAIPQFWYCIDALGDWFKNLAPYSQPNTGNCVLFQRVFPLAARICLLLIGPFHCLPACQPASHRCIRPMLPREVYLGKNSSAPLNIASPFWLPLDFLN